MAMNASTAGSGMTAGATVGSAFGPVGTVVGGVIGGIAGGLLGGKKKKAPDVAPYYEDPNFNSVQTFLKDYFQNILQGNIPDYYRAIGEPASSGLMGDYVSEATKDIFAKDLEARAMTGRGRTGISSGALERAGNISGVLRYNDYLRAMQGREDLLGLGYSGESGVRDAAAWNQNQKNAYQLGKWQADMATYQSNEQQRKEGQQSLMNGFMSMAGGVKGMFGGDGSVGGISSSGFNPSGSLPLNSKYTTSSQYIPSNIADIGTIQTKASSTSRVSDLISELIKKGVLTY